MLGRRALFRDVKLISLERIEDVAVPEIQPTLPSLGVVLISCEEAPAMEPGAVIRTRTFRIGFFERPPDGAFAGEVLAYDPWKLSATPLSLKIAGRFQPEGGLEVFPNRIQLEVGGTRETRLFVRTLAATALRIELDNPDGLPLEWREAGDDRLRIITMALTGGSRSGRATLRIKHPDEAEARLVPIEVNRGTEVAGEASP